MNSLDNMLEEFINKTTKEINELKEMKEMKDVKAEGLKPMDKDDLVVRLNIVEQYHPGRFNLDDIHKMNVGDMIEKYSNIISIIKKEELGYRYTYEELEIA